MSKSTDFTHLFLQFITIIFVENGGNWAFFNHGQNVEKVQT